MVAVDGGRDRDLAFPRWIVVWRGGPTSRLLRRECVTRGQGREFLKFCIVGPGAVGSYLACKLSQSSNEVAVLARGARLAAIRDKGITVTCAAGEEIEIHPAASDAPEKLGSHDFVLVCVKA